MRGASAGDAGTAGSCRQHSACDTGKRLAVGAVLLDSEVTYYEVLDGYGVRDYRYTVVNDRTVLVDPRTHRVVQVID